MSARRILARAAVAAVLTAVAGIAVSAVHVAVTGRTHARRRATRDRWDVWDDADDDRPLSAIEREMLDRNDFLARDAAHAMRMDLEGDDLCPS